MAGIPRAWLGWAVLPAVVLMAGLGVRALLRDPTSDLLTTAPSRQTEREPAAQPFHPQRPAAPSQDFVGSQACAECHSEICEVYQSHPMGRSLGDIATVPVVEDYTNNTSFSPPPSSRINLSWRYFVERTEHGVTHREVAYDPQEDVVYDQRVPIHFAVGSGQRGRSYIINRDGLLFMSSVTWYTEKQRWYLSPGYLVNHLRFERRVLDGCLACHTGRMATLPNQPNRYEPQPFIEETIGCERCHGPGKAHIEYRRRDPPPAGSADPIVNPLALEPSRRESVCLQCHLSGETRIPRYGRSHWDFRPGDELSDIWITFVRGTGVTADRTTAAVSQPEQMAASVCYQKSNQQLGCLSCHDPHTIPSRDERVAFYRGKCLQCHEQGTPCAEPIERRLTVAAGDSCIDCHMPRIDANDVPHTSQTDHRILRSYGESAETKGPTSHAELSVFGDTSRVPSEELERAWGIVLARHAEQNRSREHAQAAIGKLQKWFAAAPEDGAVAEALGLAYLHNLETSAALDTWKKALEHHPANEDLLRRLVFLYHDLDMSAEGIEYAQRLVAVNPWQHEHLARYAHMLGKLGRFDEAIPIALQALDINPLAASIHGWLADAYALKGDVENSRKHRQQFQKLTSRRR
uniref:Cytochrome c-552/4 domain-containing protein n=1 Tax=Schlesneria paludicola TaxID=360056 RepID=A0A7C4LRL1_9PLAN